MNKPDYYKKTECVLYEYYTLDTALPMLQRRGDKDMYARKMQLKEDVELAMCKLSKEEQDMVNHIYNNPEANHKVLCNLFCMSTPTFYRKKRALVKEIALRLGYL